MIPESNFSRNLSEVLSQIESACSQSGRSFDEIRLLPVTKNWPSDAIQYCLRASLDQVGENRVQEAREKMKSLQNVKFELIGHLQRNKVKDVVGNFYRIQTIDSIKLLERVATLAKDKSVKQKILIQVNAGNDPAKFGISMESAESLVEKALGLESIELEGLMTIAPFVPENLSIARRCFNNLQVLKNKLVERTGAGLHELSMGMSADLSEAIAEGATMIRVGSALFGNRQIR